MKKANSITVIIVIVLTVGSLALGASSDIEKKLENIYVPQLQEQLGISSSQAKTIFHVLLEKAKEESLEEGTLNWPENLGDTLLDKESTVEEAKSYLAKMRKEGITDEDIRWWWNRHDLERRMITAADEWFQYALSLKLIEDGLSRNEAAKRIRKFYPIYGDPDNISVMTGEDRPLLIELKLRVNIYMTRRRQADSEQFIKDLEESSSFNALIRREIKKGDLGRGQLVSHDVIRPKMRYAFWKFSIPLFIMSIILALFVLPLATAPLLGLAIALYERRRGLFYLVVPVEIAVTLYILVGWAAVCATRTVIFKDYATHGWFYYVAGFFLCHGPLGYMAAKEGPEASSTSCLYIALILVAFIAFCIWPSLTVWPYGWFLDWLYRI